MQQAPGTWPDTNDSKRSLKHRIPYRRMDRALRTAFCFYIRIDGKHIFFLNNLFVIPDIDVTKVWMSDTDDCIGIVASHVDAGSDMGIDKSWPARFLLDLMERNPGVRYVNSSACVDRVRSIKDEYEKEKMRESSRINDAAWKKPPLLSKKG